MGLKSSKPQYKPRIWPSAVDEIYARGIHSAIPMVSQSGPNGFPFEISGEFVKIIFKTKSKKATNIVNNIVKLKKICPNTNHLIHPLAIVESAYAYHLHFKMYDGDLLSYLHKGRRFNRTKTIQSIIDAVKYLHSNGYAHRDIKPENIVMDHGRPMLCDLDFATPLAQFAFKGTREYMAKTSILRLILEKTNNTAMSLWVDCYAIGKTIAMVLASTRKICDEIRRIDREWFSKKHSSFIPLYVDEEYLLKDSQQWHIVFAFCKDNEIKALNKETIFYTLEHLP